MAVQQVDVQPLEQAFGTIVAAREAHLRFGVAGEVERVSNNLRNGAHVKTGDILASLGWQEYRLF